MNRPGLSLVNQKKGAARRNLGEFFKDVIVSCIETKNSGTFIMMFAVFRLMPF